jgi:hypothetical protein
VDESGEAVGDVRWKLSDVDWLEFRRGWVRMPETDDDGRDDELKNERDENQRKPREKDEHDLCAFQGEWESSA